jgi:hypothetical protein
MKNKIEKIRVRKFIEEFSCSELRDEIENRSTKRINNFSEYLREEILNSNMSWDGIENTIDDLETELRECVNNYS